MFFFWKTLRTSFIAAGVEVFWKILEAKPWLEVFDLMDSAADDPSLCNLSLLKCLHCSHHLAEADHRKAQY